MIYRGYRIVKALHPTPVQPKLMTYDIKDRDGKVYKANIASLTTAQIVIDLMIKLRRWPDKKQNTEERP